jgi:phytoene synthase
MIAWFQRILELSPLAIRDSNSLDSLYTQAAEATRAGSRGFFFATRHFPLDLARAAHAVYWFCHYTLELGRHAATPEQARADLDRWASMVDSGLRGRLARHPVLDVFLDTVDQRGIPHEYPAGLIEGVGLDLDYARYRSFSQLRGRSQRVGGMVSLMMAHVIGFRGPALDYMADLGLAIELTTLLRDTGAHLERGVIYLPLEEIEAAGYSEAELCERVRNEPFRRLMRVQAVRIAEYFQNAEPGLALLDPRGRFAVRVAYDLYRQTLRYMETSDFDVFRRGAGVPAGLLRVERAWITARSMAGPITRRLWRAMSA